MTKHKTSERLDPFDDDDIPFGPFAEDEEFDEPKVNGRNGRHEHDLDEVRQPELSDDALAELFVEEYGERYRYVFKWNKWYRREPSGLWIEDTTSTFYSAARATCRQVAAVVENDRVAKAVASTKTRNAVVEMTKADFVIAATVDQWDADPWLLNTPEGAIDLRAGGKPVPRPAAYCTKATAIAPGGACPLWHSFLDRVTAGDVELQTFLQRMAGYCLTGSIEEHALFFLYGKGGNGKGRFVYALSGALGDYAVTAPMQTFTEQKLPQHETELAMLRGARLVTANETEEGRRWAEARIKNLTGGDRITARFMRWDHFTYMPQFKLLISGNHKPGLRSVDEAMRRRMHLIPFTVTIPESERDPKLDEKLKAEWPGILQWAIEGFHAWREQGLAPPEAVRMATEAYLASEDAVNAWIDDACERDRSSWEPSSALFASWKAWCERSGEFVGSKKRFAQNLEDRGFVPERAGGTGARGFRGLKINRPADEPSPYWDR
ncbi:MAG: phage/plasmid primase, P4 family [Methyloceanibacter sp.]